MANAWGVSFGVAWGESWGASSSSQPAAVLGGGRTIVIPKKKPMAVYSPRPQRHTVDDDESILIHLLS